MLWFCDICTAPANIPQYTLSILLNGSYARYDLSQLLLVLLGRHQAKLFLRFVGQDERNASIGHDAHADEDAGLGSESAVFPVARLVSG